MGDEEDRGVPSPKAPCQVHLARLAQRACHCRVGKEGGRGGLGTVTFYMLPPVSTYALRCSAYGITEGVAATIKHLNVSPRGKHCPRILWVRSATAGMLPRLLCS